jgi:drug/metabolite transporter (DMT)-like permease
VLGLLSAFSFGVSDFVGGIASRRAPALRVVLVSYPVAMVLLGVLAVGAGGPLTRGAVFWGLLGGLSQALAAWWFYAALGAGPIAVVSPLTAVLTASVPVAAGIVLGERPGQVAAVGIGLALIAVVLVSQEATDEDIRPHRFTTKVAWLTVGSGLAFGLNFVLIDQAPPESRLWPLLFGRMSATLLVLGVAAVTRHLELPTGFALRMALTAALLDTVGNVAMLLALRGSLLSLASVLVSLYPAATVVLAIVVLREKVHRLQVVGMALALVSVALIAGG